MELADCGSEACITFANVGSNGYLPCTRTVHMGLCGNSRLGHSRFVLCPHKWRIVSYLRGICHCRRRLAPRPFPRRSYTVWLRACWLSAGCMCFADFGRISATRFNWLTCWQSWLQYCDGTRRRQLGSETALGGVPLDLFLWSRSPAHLPPGAVTWEQLSPRLFSLGCWHLVYWIGCF